MSDIHKTRPPQKGPTYTVSRRWMNVVSLFIGIGVLATLLMATTLYKLNGQLERETNQTLIWKQRTDAMNELLRNRERIGRFTYQWACREAKLNNENCLVNPTWRVDPGKYPLLQNDLATGQAFFPAPEMERVEEESK